MILYESRVAPNPRRVRIFLAEKGVSVPIRQVDIGSAENRKPPFLAKNPLGGLPVLELDDGTCIAESVAICRCRVVDIRIAPEQKHLARWHEAVSARPSAKA